LSNVVYNQKSADGLVYHGQPFLGKVTIMSELRGAIPSTVAPPMSIPEAGATRPTALTPWHCQRCGSTDLASAYLVDYSDKFRQLQLAPRSLKLSKISRLLRPFRRLVNVSAQVCRHCGAITLEVNPDEFADVERKYGRR
jgi:hypothetical protein